MSEYDITKYLKFKEYNKIFENFENILKEKLPHCSHSGFYQNVKKLKFSTKSSLAERIYLRYSSDINAKYDVKKNKLSLFQKQFENTKLESDKDSIVNHELLHMSTARKDGNHYFCGFEQIDRKSKCLIGRGLNEGYTELINQRYFSTTTPVKGGTEIAYLNEQWIAYGIEMLVGKEKMEELFFNGDLDGLLTEMSKYMSMEAANRILGIANSTMKNSKDSSEIATIGKTILANNNLKKQTELYRNGKITKEEYEFQLLKIEMYTHGYTFNETSKGYEMQILFIKDPKYLSDEEYRLLQNNFKQRPNYSLPYETNTIASPSQPSIIKEAYQISRAKQVDKINMDQTENLKKADVKSNQYKTTTQNLSAEPSKEELLSQMMQEVELTTEKTTSSTNVL